MENEVAHWDIAVPEGVRDAVSAFTDLLPSPISPSEGPVSA